MKCHGKMISSIQSDRHIEGDTQCEKKTLRWMVISWKEFEGQCVSPSRSIIPHHVYFSRLPTPHLLLQADPTKATQLLHDTTSAAVVLRDRSYAFCTSTHTNKQTMLNMSARGTLRRNLLHRGGKKVKAMVGSRQKSNRCSYTCAVHVCRTVATSTPNHGTIHDHRF